MIGAQENPRFESRHVQDSKDPKIQDSQIQDPKIQGRKIHIQDSGSRNSKSPRGNLRIKSGIPSRRMGKIQVARKKSKKISILRLKGPGKRGRPPEGVAEHLRGPTFVPDVPRRRDALRAAFVAETEAVKGHAQ